MAVLGLSRAQLKPFPSDGFSSSPEKDRCCSSPHSRSYRQSGNLGAALCDSVLLQDPSLCPVIRML